MTELSGPVGLRNGVTQVANAPNDQGKIIRLLWSIEPANGGMNGVSPPPAAGPAKRCATALADALAAFQAFWVSRGEFRVADGVVDPRGTTLRKLDALAGGVAPTPPGPTPGFTDLKVLRFQQTLPVQSGGRCRPLRISSPQCFGLPGLSPFRIRLAPGDVQNTAPG